jgi:hypothetical protein
MKTNKTNILQKIKKIETNTTLYNLQELPTNMNTAFCKSMVKELQLPFSDLNNGPPSYFEDLVFISEKGYVYRKVKVTDGIEKRMVWTILHNNNGACGWYRVDSPALFGYNCNFMNCSGIQMSDGTYADFVPENPKVYHISSLRHCLVTPMTQDEIQKKLNVQSALQVQNEGKEEIYLYICAKKYGGDMLLGYMYPMINLSIDPVSDSNWIPSSEIKDQNVLNAWMNSRELSSLPFYEPKPNQSLSVFFKDTCHCEEEQRPIPSDIQVSTETNDWRGLFDWHGNSMPPMPWDTEPLTPWGEEDKNVQENVKEEEEEEEEEEYRYDPSADEWYPKGAFIDYYGDDTMWNMCSPLKNSQRWMIESYIHRFYGTLTGWQINHLLDKIVETLV